MRTMERINDEPKPNAPFIWDSLITFIISSLIEMIFECGFQNACTIFPLTWTMKIKLWNERLESALTEAALNCPINALEDEQWTHLIDLITFSRYWQYYKPMAFRLSVQMLSYFWLCINKNTISFWMIITPHNCKTILCAHPQNALYK